MPLVAETIRITFEKSHLVTIGEKLYGESLELLRELIANAYDADATEVHVDLKPQRLTVRDDGSGMDEAGLREFFRIGSQGKLRDPLSSRFRRRRIGQFGIGKFATLAACRRFRVFTQRNGFAAEAVFDKDAFADSDTADFLPITSDRSRFIADTPEYALFFEIMQRELRKIQRQVRDLEERKERAKADDTLKDTLSRMRRAIRKNPDIAPPLLSQTGEIDESSREQTEKMSSEAAPNEKDSIDAMQVVMRNITGALHVAPENDGATKEPPPQKVRVKNLEGKESVARWIIIGGIGITCALEHWGRESPAAFTEGGIVQINMDHPLYRKQQELAYPLCVPSLQTARP